MNQRLENPANGFGRPVIDRTQPLSFRLDGVEIAAFAGDTVLSAALAAGISGAGRFGNTPLNLGSGFAPLVRVWRNRDGNGAPMALTPVRDGLDLVTAGRGGGRLDRFAAQLRGRPRRSLGVDFAATPGDDFIWEKDGATTETDLLVIGGGVAGMAAALEGARRGQSVILVERRARLGGDAALFGNREGEDPVLAVIAGLEKDIAAAGVDVRCLCHAVDAGAHGVTVVSAADDGNDLSVRTERLAARRIVLATGTADRLPVFPGNRLPGVAGLAESFALAGTFGVWPEAPTLFAGGTNALYRLAMLAKESGADIIRLIDHRPAPHSRYVDFAKATGVPQEFGTRVASATAGKKGRLAVRTSLAWQESRNEGHALFEAGSVVYSDGWRPRLTLWTRLGGGLCWRETGAIPDGHRVADRVALAGGVTGLITTAGCRASGERAVAALFGEKPEPVEEARLAEYIESADAPPLKPLASTGTPAFLASAHILASMPEARSGRTENGSRAPGGMARGARGALDLEALDALTRAGLSPAARFVALAAERLISPERIVAHALDETASRPTADGLPPWLAGRFGAAPLRAVLRSDDGRAFGPGMLVFADSSESRPHRAIGVIVSAQPDGGSALIDAAAGAGLKHVNIRDGTRPLGAAIVEMTG